MIDFLIIGGGMAGISAAARIAPLGKTVVLEMEPALGYHSSGRSAALYEAQYGEPATVLLNLAGRDYFDEHGLLSPRGFMVLAPSAKKDDFKTACATFGCTQLSLDDALDVVPILNRSHVAYAGLSKDALDIDTDRMLQLFAKQARAQGADIHLAAGVEAIRKIENGWHISTADAEYETRTLINAAGAWADKIAEMASIPVLGITPCRRSMARIPAPDGHDLSGWPMLMDVNEKWYAKPDAGKLLVSPADEDPLAPQDAWADDMVLAEGIARYQEFVTPEVTRVVSSWAGLRSFAPDRNLVIGPDPNEPSFFWLAGQGGSGIQSAPGYSEYAADLIAGRKNPLTSGIEARVSPKRFSP